MRKKVTVVGAGNVGASCAVRLADRGLADIVVVDVLDGIPQGKSLDLLEAVPVSGVDVKISGCNDYSATAQSDIAVLTAGFARKPGMSRDDLLWANYDIVKATVEQVVKYSPGCILIVVTNPLDAMCHVARAVSGFPKNRVIGMAGILDTARFRTFVAQALDVSAEDVTAFVLGGHGDSMVPLVRYSSVAGIPLTDLMDAAAIDEIVKRTRSGGAEIVKYLKSGSAYYAPSAAVAEMVESIPLDRKRVFPCSVYLEGEYGIRDLFVGVPVKLGERGAEKVFEARLTESELAALHKSGAAVKELVDVMASKLAELQPAAVAG